VLIKKQRVCCVLPIGRSTRYQYLRQVYSYQQLIIVAKKFTVSIAIAADAAVAACLGS